MTDHKKHLYYMNELSDYQIADGFPDVRGWDVKDIDNRVIGTVDNLLVNAEAERVVYLDVEVDQSIIDAKHDPYGRPNNSEVREFVNQDGENHIIIPIGLVDLNTDSDYVYTDVIDHRTFAETKRYRKGDDIRRDYEIQVLSSYDRKSRSEDRDNFMNNDRNDRDYTDNDRNDNDFFDNDRNDRDYSDNDRNERNFFNDDTNDRERKNRTTYNDIPNESRIREIVREEIRDYHETDSSSNYRGSRYSNDMDDDDDVVMTDEELKQKRNRRNRNAYDDDNFYERREFDDRRFRKKRTPGL